MARERRVDPGTFGGLLRKYRTAGGLSQAALGQRARLSSSLVALLELGRRRPGREKVLRLADALGLDEDDRSRLLLQAGHAPAGPVPAPDFALKDVAEALEEDQRLTVRQKMVAESLIRSFATWVREELARGTLDGPRKKR